MSKDPMRLLLRTIFGRLSVFTACSLTSGAVAGLLSLIFTNQPYLFFTFGSFLPVAPLTLYFSSVYALRRSIEKWKALQKDGIITEGQFRLLRNTAVEWYRQRWFGASDFSAPDEEQPKDNAS